MDAVAAIEVPQEIYGPFGALVILVVVVGILGKVIQALWADHKRSDQEDRDQRDQALRIVEGVVPTLKELAAAQSAANKRSRADDVG